MTRPLHGSRRPDVDARLRERPAREHRAVACRAGRLAALHVLHGSAAIRRGAKVVGEAPDMRDSPGKDDASGTRGAGGEGAAVLRRLRKDGGNVRVGWVVGVKRTAIVRWRSVGAE